MRGADRDQAPAHCTIIERRRAHELAYRRQGQAFVGHPLLSWRPEASTRRRGDTINRNRLAGLATFAPDRLRYCPYALPYGAWSTDAVPLQGVSPSQHPTGLRLGLKAYYPKSAKVRKYESTYVRSVTAHSPGLGRLLSLPTDPNKSRALPPSAVGGECPTWSTLIGRPLDVPSSLDRLDHVDRKGDEGR